MSLAQRRALTAFTLATVAALLVVIPNWGKRASSPNAGRTVSAKEAFDSDHRLAFVNKSAGPRYSRPEEATRANEVAVPACGRARWYNSPRPGVVWVHFDSPSVVLGVFRGQPNNMSPGPKDAPGAEHFTRYTVSIDGHEALGSEWDGQMTVINHPDGSTERIGGVYKSTLAWNIGSNGYVVYSEDLPFSEMMNVVEDCKY